MKSLVLLSALLIQGNPAIRLIHEIHGKVIDATGNLVSKAAVEAVGWEGEISGKTIRLVSGTDGSFTLESPGTGKYRIYAWKDSAGVPETRALIFQGDTQLYSDVFVESGAPVPLVTLRLPPAYGEINGHIVDAVSQLPIAKPRIRLERVRQPEIMYETSAEADGSYMLHLPARPIRIIISAPGYRPWVYHGAGRHDSIVLEAGTSVTVNVKLLRE